MEYKKELGHLNFARFVAAMNIPLADALEVILQRKEMAVQDIIEIVTLEDLCIINKQIYDASKLLVDLMRKEEDIDTCGKIADCISGLNATFDYIHDVLMEKNVPEATVREILNGANSIVVKNKSYTKEN